MTDVDDDWEDDPFWDASDPEPNCPNTFCYDSGWFIDYTKRKPRFGRRRQRRCPCCNPTRLQRWWLERTRPLRSWWHARRRPVITADDPWGNEPPY